MALKGTIKDFGVADIFQLISQQAKTGVLVLSNDVDSVRVYFKDGSVVRAENTTRPAQMLLGAFMVRATVIAQEQLDQALKEQAKTLKRIGAVLVDLQLVTPAIITEFATLQMTETIYQLFEWKVGTYEFESVEVEPSPEGVKPIRAETIVMNGIRMTDEWPGIRERITSYGWKVERMRELPPPSNKPKRPEDEFDFSSFESGGNGGSGDIDDIGSYERNIYALIAPNRTVQQLIDLSRLGEFEACRALSTLVGEGYIRVVRPGDPETTDLGDSSGGGMRRILETMIRVGISATLVVAAAWLLTRAPTQLGLRQSATSVPVRSQAVAAHVAEAQLRVLRRALDIYRFSHGSYPEKLDLLVAAGLIRDRDLRFPFREPYYYEVVNGVPELLPPLF